MDGFLVDRSQLSPRKVGLAVNNDADTGGGFVMRSRHSSVNPYSSLPFFSQLSPNHDGFRSQLCSFLPSSFCTDRALIPPPPPRPLPLRQPPLLPLPQPTPGLKLTKTNSDTGMFRSRDHRMKLKPSVKITRKEPPPKAAHKCREPKGERKMRVEKVTAVNNEEGEEVAESIYSLSPPPSNLPLPSFLLSSHRDTATRCWCITITPSPKIMYSCTFFYLFFSDSTLLLLRQREDEEVYCIVMDTLFAEMYHITTKEERDFFFECFSFLWKCELRLYF